MKNIFVSDIDGTLTGFSQPKLDPFGIEALKIGSELGEVVLASARPFYGIINMYAEKELVFDYIISLNGGHILHKKKTITTFPISQNVVDYFVKNQDNYSNLWFYTESCWYASSLTTEEYSKESYAVNYEALSLKEYHSEEVLKILIVSAENRDGILLDLKEKFKDITLTTSSESYVEVFSSDINKFLAIKSIFPDKTDKIFSFGDSNNDLEMIKNSFFGSAVNNATPLVKEVAKYISKYSFGEGVLDSMKHIKNKFFI